MRTKRQAENARIAARLAAGKQDRTMVTVRLSRGSLAALRQVLRRKHSSKAGICIHDNWEDQTQADTVIDAFLLATAIATVDE